MQVITEIAQLQQFLNHQKLNQKKIGFVPTMGALHKGHLTLINQSIADNDLTVCSIYINPTQFNNQSDLVNYPRKLDDDKALLAKSGCDVLFAPSDDEIYGEAPVLKISFGLLEKTMEAKFREGHFNGVAIIVSKLFNLIRPDKAYFGQKDIQQYFIIKQLVKDLSFPVQLIKVPTVREPDGLAMSSRNSRLSPELREKAPLIHRALVEAGNMLGQKKTIEEIKTFIKELFHNDNDFKLEYFEVADANSLEILNRLPKQGEVVLCIAVYLGGIRLIDNMFLFL